MNSMIPVARYRFTARMGDALRLPDYAGSLLRGQFGAALRDASCMTRLNDCRACPLRSTCPYTRVFEAPAPAGPHAVQNFSTIPNAYVVEPPSLGAPRDLQPGAQLVFHMVLAGTALDQLALIVFAWQRALARGLGKSRSRAELEAVDWIDAAGNGQPVWRHTEPLLADHAATLDAQADDAAPPHTLSAITLQIDTPLRLQRQGHALGVAQLSPRALIATLTRRIALLMEFHAGDADWGTKVPALVRHGETLSDQRALRWHDWTRYSSRQQQEMTLGGVLGRWTLRGDPDSLAAVWPWLWLGQWLHVGKNATMGMGGYRLEAGA